MKKSLHFALVMAMGMMAMSPATAWAEDAFSVTIGGTTTNYEDVSAAFEAASAGTAATPATVTMLADYDKPVTGQYFVKLTSGVMTLDLNDHTLSMTSNQSVISVQGADLTIVDNGVQNAGKLLGGYVALDYQFGKLAIYGGTYSGSYTSLVAGAWGQRVPNGIVLRGGTFVMSGSNAILVNYDGPTNYWEVIDMSGYIFVDENGNTVEIPTIPVITTTVKVVPETSTGINDLKVEGSKAVKSIENGQLVITKDGKRYNAAGQMMK